MAEDSAELLEAARKVADARGYARGFADCAELYQREVSQLAAARAAREEEMRLAAEQARQEGREAGRREGAREALDTVAAELAALDHYHRVLSGLVNAAEAVNRLAKASAGGPTTRLDRPATALDRALAPAHALLDRLGQRLVEVDAL